MPPRSFTRSLMLALVTIAVGLIVRFAPLGLPQFVTKYGGSMLWALMIYWIVSARRWFTGPKVQGSVEEMAAIEAELDSLA